MSRVFHYYSRVQSVRGNLLGLPAWARFLLFLLALPGILAVSLSVAAFLVSLLALLLLTVPVYRLLRAAVGTPVDVASSPDIPDFVESSGFGRADAKRIDVTVRDASETGEQAQPTE
jgi:hypothetical protein